MGHAIREICPEAVFLTSRDGDLRDRNVADHLLGRHQPDYVLHLAARVGGVKANRDGNADFFSDNIQINVNVLTAAQRFKVKGLISVLSACAYSFYSDRPSTENDLHVGMPFEGNAGYGYAKRLLDIQSRLLAQQYGCRYATLTPVTMYGPHDNFDSKTGHVIGALIQKCFSAKQRRQPFKVWGTGSAVRQFVYVKDVARLLLTWIRQVHDYESAIMAPDAGLTIRDLARTIAKVIDFKGAIVFDAAEPEGQLIRRLESTRFQNLFPCFQYTDFENGLQETIQWFQSNSNKNFEFQG